MQNSLSLLASGFFNNTSADGVAHWSTEAASLRFLVNCTIRCPVSQSLFPTPQKAASTLLGYGPLAQQVIQTWTLWWACLSFLVQICNLALVLDRLRARGALFGQDALADQQYPVDYHLGRKFGISMEEAAGRIQWWQG